MTESENRKNRKEALEALIRRFKGLPSESFYQAELDKLEEPKSTKKKE